MIITEILTNANRKFPDNEAIVYKNKRLTYSQLQEMVERLASAFIREGIKKGDRVALLLRNCPESIIAFYAIVKIGAVEVALNPITDSPQNIIYMLKDCKPKAFITNSKNVGLVSEALVEGFSFIKTCFFMGDSLPFKNFKQKCIALEDIFKSRMYKEPKVNIEENDAAIIAYTSGTTASPKGVILTHLNLVTVAEIVSKDYKDIKVKEGIILLLIQLCHAFGKKVINSRFINGATIVLLENIIFPIEIIRMIQREKVTGIVGVPTIYRMILEALKKSKKTYDFGHIRYTHSGGSKMSPELINEMHRVFYNAIVSNGYGLTEAGPRVSIMCFPPGKVLDKTKIGSCGKACYKSRVSIVDEAGKKIGKGGIGEVIFKSGGVMKGYWKKPKETEKVLKDGWLYTGDIGKVDKEEYLYLIDRKKDIIKSGGELISPKEIEMVIDSHPKVEESAVIGIKDNFLGEKIKAFVVPKSKKKINEDEIICFCSKHLSFIKIPKNVEFRSSLPKSTLGKVKKAALKREINS